MKSQSTVEITKALVSFQSQLKPIARGSTNPYYNSKYASMEAIWETIRKPLASNGFAVSQLLSAEGDQIILVTLLLHTSGEWLESNLLVSPAKEDNPQAAGSAITYARRYALSAILGVCSEEDDDAEAATKRESPARKSEVKPIAQPGVKPAVKPARMPVGAQDRKPLRETAVKPVAGPRAQSDAVKMREWLVANAPGRTTLNPATEEIMAEGAPFKPTASELNDFAHTCREYGYGVDAALEILGVGSLKEWLKKQPLYRAVKALELYHMGKPAPEPKTQPGVKPHKTTSAELNEFTSTCQQYGYGDEEVLGILGVASLKEWLQAQPLRRATEAIDTYHSEARKRGI